jgi:hypothetical protein
MVRNMSKKVYLTPAVSLLDTDAEELLVGSKDIYNEERNIGYGGVDEEGTKDPAARGLQDIWDD